MKPSIIQEAIYCKQPERTQPSLSDGGDGVAALDWQVDVMGDASLFSGMCECVGGRQKGGSGLPSRCLDRDSIWETHTHTHTHTHTACTRVHGCMPTQTHAHT